MYLTKNVEIMERRKIVIFIECYQKDRFRGEAHKWSDTTREKLTHGQIKRGRRSQMVRYKEGEAHNCSDTKR
jgi:hypothetical protein